MKKKIKKALKIISDIILIVSFLAFLSSLYISTFFSDVTFEQLLYSVINFKGTNMEIIFEGLGIVLVVLIIVYLIYRFLKFLLNKINYKVIIKFNIGKKSLIFNYKLIIKTILIIIFLYSSYNMFKINEYIEMLKTSTNLYEKYYVDPRDTILEFPNKKRNLIYIYLESMEMTNASIDNGGDIKKSYIPKLEEIALNNINFSNTDKLGGIMMIYGANYTTASLIAQTSGVPLKVSIGWRNYKNYGKNLPGVYSLGDILEDNGYKNYFMLGSDADYGGIRDYFRHGNYTMYDHYWAQDEGLISKGYKVWWGFEDLKLFSFAKDKLTEISKNDEPFNFTLITADTHFSDGYQDSSCKQLFDRKYANSIYCSDEKVYDFVNWIKEQDFYDNTTIIIAGDHLTPQKFFYRMKSSYKRVIYDAIINSSVEPVSEKNRIFTAFDMFPTTLASLGVKIKGDRLGLGVNLFSKEKTLAETLGFENFEKELKAKSFYYDNYLLKDHYYKMQKEEKNEKEKSSS